MIETRRATANDEPLARTLHEKGYRDVVERQFGTWDQSAQESFFLNKWNPERFEIVQLDGVPVDYFSWENRDDHVFASELVILPEFRGRGIGSHLLKQLKEQASVLNIPLKPQALRENHLAIALYMRLGINYYDTNETHCMMAWQENISLDGSATRERK